jgi:hypothetical protein
MNENKLYERQSDRKLMTLRQIRERAEKFNWNIYETIKGKVLTQTKQYPFHQSVYLEVLDD